MKLSKHFDLSEFTHSQSAERLHLENCPTGAHLNAMATLCNDLLEFIREKYGVIIISSGYRSTSLNKAIGGSQHSQHSKGEAADILIPAVDAYDVCKWIESSGIEFDQLIYEGNWTHISYRSNRNRNETLTAVFQPGHPTKYVQGIVS